LWRCVASVARWHAACRPSYSAYAVCPSAAPPSASSPVLPSAAERPSTSEYRTVVVSDAVPHSPRETSADRHNKWARPRTDPIRSGAALPFRWAARALCVRAGVRRTWRSTRPSPFPGRCSRPAHHSEPSPGAHVGGRKPSLGANAAWGEPSPGADAAWGPVHGPLANRP
jgi:hypothetical protein